MYVWPIVSFFVANTMTPLPLRTTTTGHYLLLLRSTSYDAGYGQLLRAVYRADATFTATHQNTNNPSTTTSLHLPTPFALHT